MLAALRSRALLASRLASASTSSTRSLSTSLPVRKHYNNVTADQFEERVIQAPEGRLVLVDFFATWCGPCKFLTPLLEKVVPDNADIDREPLARARALCWLPSPPY